MKLMRALKHELSLFATATVFAIVCALAWGRPFVGHASNLGNVFTPSGARSSLRTQVFRGTVLRDGAQLLLQDGSGQVFKLDNAAQAEPYLGKMVTITGQIDAANGLIRLQRIENPRA